MDIDTRLWASWLAVDIDPATALATPAALPTGPIWDELALKYMVLDRVRLAGLAAPLVSDELVQNWVSQTLDDLNRHLEEISEL